MQCTAVIIFVHIPAEPKYSCVSVYCLDWEAIQTNLTYNLFLSFVLWAYTAVLVWEIISDINNLMNVPCA